MRLIAGLATLLSVLCFATGVSAHASLVATEPADGSVLTTAPKTIQLRFNETVAPAVVNLIDAEGKARDDATISAVDQTIFIVPPANLPRGNARASTSSAQSKYTKNQNPNKMARPRKNIGCWPLAPTEH